MAIKMPGRDEGEYQQRELESLRDNVDTIRTEVAAMQRVLAMLDRSLFGNGQPGMIAKLQEKDEKQDKAIVAIEKSLIKYGAIAVTILGLLQFLTGGGWASLKNILGK